MFPQFKKINNKSGIVLFMVLMIAIIIMIVSASILSQSMNEINYAQQQIDQIASDQLAKGIFWNTYSSNCIGAQGSGCGYADSVTLQNVQTSTIMQGRKYQISLNSTGAAQAGDITSYNTVANYDTFN